LTAKQGADNVII